MTSWNNKLSKWNWPPNYCNNIQIISSYSILGSQIRSMNILKCECSIYPGYQVSSGEDVGDFSCIKNMFSDVDFQFIRWHLLISKCQKCLFTFLLYRNCPLEKVNKLAGIRSRPSSWTMDAVSQSLSWWSDKCSQLFGDGGLEFQTKDSEDFTFSQSLKKSFLGPSPSSKLQTSIITF